MHNAIFSDVFWTILVLFIVGLPLLRSTVKMPRKLVFNKVDDGALTPQQAAFFQKYDRELGDLGFYPALTYTVPNLSGKNLSRTYFSSAEPTRVNVCTMTTAKGGHAHSFVEIVTSWEDGALARQPGVPGRERSRTEAAARRQARQHGQDRRALGEARRLLRRLRAVPQAQP